MNDAKPKLLQLIKSVLFACPLLVLTLAGVRAADIDMGKRVYNRCIACHYADREGNKIGPSLLNIMGRKAGTVAGYRYSPAMVKAGEEGLSWDKETMKTYLHNPQGLIKGTRMASVRIRDDAEIDALIDYLQSVENK